MYTGFIMIMTSGECISRFTNRKVAYCIKFHPEEDKQNFFVAGTSDKKIVCVSISLPFIQLYQISNNLVYDHVLCASFIM
jgi:hypothetical protein